MDQSMPKRPVKRELLKSPPSPGKKLLRSVHNQMIPQHLHFKGNDSRYTNLSLRHIDLTRPDVLPAIMHQCGTRTGYVHSLDISYSIANETTLNVLCSYLPHLQCLTAVQCGLSDIAEDTRWPKGLRTINFSRNMLTRFPSGLDELIELTELNLSGNAISKLDPDVLKLPKLQKFHFVNNPVSNVPKSVCREGVSELRKFFNVNPLHLTSTELQETMSLSTSPPEKCLDLRRYLLRKQGSVESGYESGHQSAMSESTTCSVSSLSDKGNAGTNHHQIKKWPTFRSENLPEGYCEVGRSKLCQVYLPDSCMENVQIEIVKDLSLHPKIQPDELLITPVVRITPHGLTFPKDKPAIVLLTHCTKPNDCGSLKVVPLCSSTRVDQSPQWSQISSHESEIFQNCVTFSTQHFSFFAVIGSIPYPSTLLPITPSNGGLLEILDLPGFKITIPPNSISSPNTVKATIYFADEPYAIDDSQKSLASACVGIEPHGLQFESPVTISIPIPDYVEIKESFPNASLQLYHAPSTNHEHGNLEWELADDQISLIMEENGIVTASFNTSHFSFYEFLWTVKDTLSLGASNIYKQLFNRDHFVSVRCQAFMSPPLSDQTFGMVVCIYKFGDPLTELSNYPWLVADSGEKQTFFRVGDLHITLEGCFTARTELGESLNRSTAIIDFRGEDFCTRFEFALLLSSVVRSPLSAGQILGKLRFTQFNGNSPVFTDYNITMPNIACDMQRGSITSPPLPASMDHPGYRQSELTPPWSPDTDIQMDCDEVFTDHSVSSHDSAISVGNQQGHSTTGLQSQPTLTRGKHKRQESLYSYCSTSTFSSPVSRAKRRLFLRRENISDKTLIEISREACSKYIDLGIQLGLSYSTLQSTVGAMGVNKQEHLKTFYVLQDWKAMAGSDFTFMVLARALEDVGLATVAQKFCYIEE